MDCPEPIKIETPDLKQKKAKKFDLIDDKGKKHQIEIGVTNNSILFKTEIENGIITKKFDAVYTYGDLKKNNIFILQDNVEEIYDQLEIYINNEPITSKIYEDKIIITLSTKIKKYPEITFELKQEVLDKDKLINIMVDKISNLELENKTLKTEIENLKNNLKSINEYINEQKEKEKERKKNYPFIDSLIVKEDEINMIKNWIKPNSEIKAKLLYRVSRDGDGPDIFHKYCDNQGPTIMFAKINNGYRFGGFSGISWESKRQAWVKDKDAFLFSLNNKLKIMNNNTNSSVYHGSLYGPDFGNHKDDLIINYHGNKCLTGKKNFCDDSGGAFTFKNKDLVGIDSKGPYYFDVEDYEVYSITANI